MNISTVNPSSQHIYLNLAQAYEAEFSAITEKRPNEDGVFELDTPLDASHVAYIVYQGDSPAGLANIAIKEDQHFEVCEFYILPVYRKQGLGTGFITEVFKQHSGHWEIKQIEGAEYATEFWRKVLKSQNFAFEENAYLDALWGYVTRQAFVV